jgi:hypothetical protein
LLKRRNDEAISNLPLSGEQQRNRAVSGRDGSRGDEGSIATVVIHAFYSSRGITFFCPPFANE